MDGDGSKFFEELPFTKGRGIISRHIGTGPGARNRRRKTTGVGKTTED